jgi:hypothetical protein
MSNCLIRQMPPVPPELTRALVLYTRIETATLMQCHVNNVDRLAKSGKLTPTRIGGRIFFSPEAIAACCGQTLQRVAA